MLPPALYVLAFVQICCTTVHAAGVGARQLVHAQGLGFECLGHVGNKIDIRTPAAPPVPLNLWPLTRGACRQLSMYAPVAAGEGPAALHQRRRRTSTSGCTCGCCLAAGVSHIRARLSFTSPLGTPPWGSRQPGRHGLACGAVQCHAVLMSLPRATADPLAHLSPTDSTFRPCGHAVASSCATGPSSTYMLLTSPLAEFHFLASLPLTLRWVPSEPTYDNLHGRQVRVGGTQQFCSGSGGDIPSAQHSTAQHGHARPCQELSEGAQTAHNTTLLWRRFAAALPRTLLRAPSGPTHDYLCTTPSGCTVCGGVTSSSARC